MKCIELLNQCRINKPFFDITFYKTIKAIKEYIELHKIDDDYHWKSICLRGLHNNSMSILTNISKQVEDISEVIRTRIKEVEIVK